MTILLLLAALQGGAPDTTRLTLVDAVTRALRTYPTVAAARAQRDQAAADLGDAKSAWLPRLTVDASLTR